MDSENEASAEINSLKLSDGAMAEDEYAPIRQKRAEWRTRINELESQAAA